MIESIYNLKNAGCMEKNKDNCKLSNIRVHSSDIRFTSIPILQHLRNILVYTTYCWGYDSNPKCQKFYNDSLIYENINKSLEEIKEDIDQALVQTKITKQIQNIPTKYNLPKQYIQNFYEETIFNQLSNIINSTKEFEDLRNWYKKYDINLNKYDDDINLNTDDLNKFIKFSKNSNDIISSIMDIYLKARVFRSFQDTPNKYSKESKNIIIYAGYFHSENYSKMFKELGFKTLYSSINNNLEKYRNCISISGLDKVYFLK